MSHQLVRAAPAPVVALQRVHSPTPLVLVVEDSPTDALLTAGLLRSCPEGYAVETAASLADASVLAALRQPYCLLVDLSLPDGEGLETVSRIRADYPSVPIVVLTGRAEDDVLGVDALQVGAQDYLLKNDLDQRTLRRAIRHAVERKRSDDEIRRREEFARTVLDALGAPTAVLDAQGMVVAVNEPWRAVTSRNDGDPLLTGVGANYIAVCERAAAAGDDSAGAIALGLRDVVDGRLSLFERDYSMVLEARATWHALRASGMPGGGAVVSHVDVTARVLAEERLAKAALHDPLTGLPNRTLLGARIDHALARLRRSPVSFALFFIDLDRFKEVNDEFGHEAGDDVLRAVGARMSAIVRGTDTVARLSGDEFVILCEDVGSDADAATVAKHIAEALSRPVPTVGTEVEVGASIGVLRNLDPDADPAALLRDADSAMYRSKSTGRGTVTMAPLNLPRQGITGPLPRAIAAGGVRVCFRPQLSAATEAVGGMTAVGLWQPAGEPALATGALRAYAEGAGCLAALDRLVLQQSLALAAGWLQTGRGTALTVPIGGSLLADSAFPGEVARLLTRHGVDAGRLTIEVADDCVADAADPGHAGVAALREAGVRVVWTVASGGATFESIDTLAVDEVWADCSVLTSLVTAAPLLALINRLSLPLVATGVATAVQWSSLRRLERELTRGHRLGPAVTAEALAGMLAGAEE